MLMWGMKEEYYIRNTFNGNVLAGAEGDNYFDEDCRLWSHWPKTKFFIKEKAEEIAETIDFAEVLKK